MMHSRFACGAALACVSLACGPEQPSLGSIAPPEIDAVLVHESPRLQIFTPPDMRFCRGDGARIDAHLRRMSSKLGVEPPMTIPVYLVANDQGESIADWCFGSFKTLGGCFQPWVIMAKAWAVPHELNHVVLEVLNDNHDVRGASLFWFEGYASAWETHATTLEIDGLREQERWAAYRTADHLIRWLEDTRGTAAVRDFYAMLDRDWQPADVEAAFVDMFGMSYEQALAQYQAEAPPRYPGNGWCDDVEVIDVPFGRTDVTLRADCDATDTHAVADLPVDGMYVRRILRLEKPADVWIEYSDLAGVLTRHPCLETPIESEDDPRLAEQAWVQAGSVTAPLLGLASTMDGVPAGDNLVEFVVPFGAPVELDVIIRAKPATF